MHIFINIQFKTLPLDIINQFAGLLTDAPAHRQGADDLAPLQCCCWSHVTFKTHKSVSANCQASFISEKCCQLVFGVYTILSTPSTFKQICIRDYSLCG